MKVSFDEMRSYIENYSRNLEDYERIEEKLKAKSYNTKITASYGFNSGGGGSFNSSKVENKVIERDELICKLKTFAFKINIVNEAEKILNKHEKEIIEYLKLGIT